MDEHGDHNALMQAVAAEYQEILDTSEQGVYIYFDDETKVCNEKFATLLGYSSPEEWAEVHESFPDVFVAENSQEQLVNAFQDAMEKGVASKNSITWKKKDGGTAESSVILVPISFEGHTFAFHFISST